MAKKHKNKDFFAAFDGRGNLLTATIRPTEEEAAKVLRRFNPPVSGFSYPYKILPVTCDADQVLQYQLIFDGD